jgi:glycerol-3-phosphate acyltransferase PlsX
VALALMVPGLILMLPGLALLYPSVASLRKRVDWREIGGAPLLGVNGVVVIGHGRSDAVAIQNMIRMAEKSVQQNLVQAIKDELIVPGVGKS